MRCGTESAGDGGVSGMINDWYAEDEVILTKGQPMTDNWRTRIKTAIHQWLCHHFVYTTTYEVGDRVVISRTVCDDCGKGVSSHQNPLAHQEAMELLRANFPRTGT